VHAALALAWPPTARAALTIGLPGGFTTYSSFNFETMLLFEEARAAYTVAYYGGRSRSRYWAAEVVVPGVRARLALAQFR
jgi:hypothetical protein